MSITFDGFVHIDSYTHDVYPDNIILVQIRRNYYVFYLPAAVMGRLESLDAAKRVDLYFDNDRSVILDFHKKGGRKCFRTIGAKCRAARISGTAIIKDKFEHRQKFLIEEIEQADDHIRVLAVAEQEAESGD